MFTVTILGKSHLYVSKLHGNLCRGFHCIIIVCTCCVYVTFPCVRSRICWCSLWCIKFSVANSEVSESSLTGRVKSFMNKPAHESSLRPAVARGQAMHKTEENKSKTFVQIIHKFMMSYRISMIIMIY